MDDNISCCRVGLFVGMVICKIVRFFIEYVKMKFNMEIIKE